MALISCQDCKNKISDQAINCPHCGRPVKPAIKSFVIDDNVLTKKIKSNGFEIPKSKSEKILFTCISLFIFFIFASTCSNIKKQEKLEQDSIKAQQTADLAKAKAETLRFNSLSPAQQIAERKQIQKQEAIAAQKAQEIAAKETLLAAANIKTLMLIDQIKSSTRNPASFEVISAGYTEKGASCLQYRGQNGFGGYSVEYVTMVNGKIKSNNATQWNKHCANQSIYTTR